MSLLYRAIWQDDRPGLIEAATTTFRDWVSDKHGDSVSFGDGDMEMNGGVGASARTVESGGVVASEAVLVEEYDIDRWMTRQRVIIDPSGEQWLWVDVERTTADVFRRQDIAAPRLVRQHLEAGNQEGGRPRIGPTPLYSVAYAVPRNKVEREVVASIRNPDRTAPLVVFSHDEQLEPRDTMKRATRTQEVLAGVARVVALTPPAQEEFDRLLGHELSVWGGAARVYLPGSLEPWRHRYLLRDVVERHPREAGRRIAHMLSGPIAARRAPQSYEKVRLLLRGSGGKSIDELLDLADVELAERDQLIEDLRSELEGRDELLLDRAGDIEQLSAEVDDERRKYRQLQWQLDNPSGHGDTTELEIPDTVTSLTEAAELCRQHLPLVVLHEDACHDLIDLDAAPESTAWARTSWRGFRALAAYAAEAAETDGGFWEWCKHSAHPDTWPATDKKLAMTESETVKNSAKLRAARQLPVDPQVEPSGCIEMLAHLKIAEGGGHNIPRIYFHDDTAGPTGKMHVGFFGPHSYMQNSKT